ncbi:unnamed protein product [Brassicogethes aeneus]|uniref:FAM20 C-terminal domain-containing protein n=1 Tax=Brassicogethes aeneus TaxID=1431903 RepID=A0A9P0AZZ5_BRAAE|nr:unnamed protein product [Brassicogethes aeneus]
MIRKRKIVLLTVIILLLYLVTTNYILIILNKSENGLESNEVSVEKYILKKLDNLSPEYIIKPKENVVIETLIKNIKLVSKYNVKDVWSEADSWVTNSQVVNVNSSNVGNVLNALKDSKIIRADLDTRGTQLKFLLTLEGNQLVVFKPKWYEIDRIIEGPVYAGKDRYGSEILGFYLSLLFKKPLTPLSVERDISLSKDVIPVATKRLLETSFQRGNKTCVFGRCLYCRKEDPICDNEENYLKGAVIFNIKGNFKTHRSPWQRTYKKGKKAAWEKNPNYCKVVKEKLSKKRLYDLIDISIFDFLLQNGDRHHYETMDDTVLLLDNGKGLGNPLINHIDILAPLYQCCILRRETLNNLMQLRGGKLREYLDSMPKIWDIVTKAHLIAIEKRLQIVFATVEYCKSIKRREQNV